MSSIKSTYIDGDVSVGRNAAIGGDATVQGKTHLKGNVTIDGWLEAKNIKCAAKGLFTTPDKLKETYPRPRNGWWALVGTSLPAPIYAAMDGEWVPTGGKGGDVSVEGGDAYSESIKEIQADIEELAAETEAQETRLSDVESGMIDLDTNLKKYVQGELSGLESDISDLRNDFEEYIKTPLTDEQKEEIIGEIKEGLPTSYPANGGNADTVEGMHAKDFCRAVFITEPFQAETTTEEFIEYLQQKGILPADTASTSGVCYIVNQPTDSSLTTNVGNIPLGNAMVSWEAYDARKFSLTIQPATSGVTYHYTNGGSWVSSAGALASALTISLNGTSQGPYNGSAPKEINITPAGIGAVPALGLPDAARQNAAISWSLQDIQGSLYVPGKNKSTVGPNMHSASFPVRCGDPVYVLELNPAPATLTASSLMIMARPFGAIDGDVLVYQQGSINHIGAVLFTEPDAGNTNLVVSGFMFYPSPSTIYTIMKTNGNS